MAQIKKNDIGTGQFGGVEPCGNATTYRAVLETTSAGVPINSNSGLPLASGTTVVLESLPQGMILEDAQVIVSNALSAGVTGSLGFIYQDGVDVPAFPQDLAHFGAGISLSAAGRTRTTSAKALVKLPKDAFLTLTTAGAACTEAGRVDVVVHGERIGYL